jgi:peptide subunit release factor 1 (eRF1)
MCDDHFHLDEIIPMYDDTLSHRVDGAVYVDGSTCIQYLIQDGRLYEVDRFDIRLISQFKNGGQSSNRLERIVDENRNVFVQKVVESCLHNFYDKDTNCSKISNLVLYGPSRFKEDVATYNKPCLSQYFKYIELITVSDSSHTDKIFEYLEEIIDPIEEHIWMNITEMIELADPKLEFGEDIQVQLANCMLEKVIIDEELYNDEFVSQLNYEPEIIVIRSSKYRTCIQNYGGIIGIKWY